MKKYLIKGKFNNNKAGIQASLPLISFTEDESFIVYCPALDVSGYGDNKDEALQSFVITLNEFFDYTINKSTLDVELKQLGWGILGAKKRDFLS